MSTDYVPDRTLTTDELERAVAGTGLSWYRECPGDADRAVTDGAEGYLWVSEGDGEVYAFSRYGSSRPAGVIYDLQRALGLELVSEHDERYEALVTPDENAV